MLLTKESCNIAGQEAHLTTRNQKWYSQMDATFKKNSSMLKKLRYRKARKPCFGRIFALFPKNEHFPEKSGSASLMLANFK